jgi:thioredoxin 1
MSGAHNITDDNFSNETSNGFVLVDFWAEWCGPCKQLGPVIEEVANELQGKVKVCKMNVDENPETPSKFGVRGIPTLVLLQDGKPVATKVGALQKSALVSWLNDEIA